MPSRRRVGRVVDRIRRRGGAQGLPALAGESFASRRWDVVLSGGRPETAKAAFDSVVEQHGPAILRLCLALLPRHDAEDAWSETFLAALGAYPDLPAEANVQAWLVTIAKRKAIDRYRAAARAPEPVPDPPDASPRPPDPHEHDDLRAAVRALPPAQREAIALHYLADLPYADVAALTGRSPAAVRRAAADGVGALRRQFPEGANR